MFNVFLPKLLESVEGRNDILASKTLEDSLWDVVIFTIGGCPGAIVGISLTGLPFCLFAEWCEINRLALI